MKDLFWAPLPAVFLALALGGCGKAAPPKPGPEGGKAVFQAVNCKACHRVGSEGTGSGPDLTMVGFRKSAAWLDAWLKDPQAWRPGTMMPNPRLSDPARKALVDYLSTLKGP